jgi:glycosyltransferase involved in cell wall biosynthesis
VIELTKAFDVFVVSSHHEGVCTTLIDAMAAARPSVATAVGGVPEVLADGETGFLVPPGDQTAMARRIVQLLKDPALRARMGAAALARARRGYTVDQMVAGTEAVYEHVLNSDRG